MTDRGQKMGGKSELITMIIMIAAITAYVGLSIIQKTHDVPVTTILLSIGSIIIIPLVLWRIVKKPLGGLA